MQDYIDIRKTIDLKKVDLYQVELSSAMYGAKVEIELYYSYVFSFYNHNWKQDYLETKPYFVGYLNLLLSKKRLLSVDEKKDLYLLVHKYVEKYPFPLKSNKDFLVLKSIYEWILVNKEPGNLEYKNILKKMIEKKDILNVEEYAACKKAAGRSVL